MLRGSLMPGDSYGVEGAVSARRSRSAPTNGPEPKQARLVAPVMRLLSAPL